MYPVRLGFQPVTSQILKRSEFKNLLADRNFVRVDEDDFKQRCRITTLERQRFGCPKVRAREIRHYPQGERYAQGIPDGKLLMYFKLTPHSCHCPECGADFYESFSFRSSPKARIAKGLEQLIPKILHDPIKSGRNRHFPENQNVRTT